MNSVLILVFYILASSQAAPDPSTNINIENANIDVKDSEDQVEAACFLFSFPFASVGPKTPWVCRGSGDYCCALKDVDLPQLSGRGLRSESGYETHNDYETVLAQLRL